jgi:UDP-N-acetylmuramoylalanine--D-glutamate ligase
MSEFDFALNFVKPKRFIAVTGTNGKTTTTTLIYEIIKKA